jgi:hypothetical protein
LCTHTIRDRCSQRDFFTQYVKGTCSHSVFHVVISISLVSHVGTHLRQQTTFGQQGLPAASYWPFAEISFAYFV